MRFVGVVLLLCGGALFWARGRDPFQRDWFSIPVAGQGRVRCVAVLPKNAPRPYPVVVYLHGAGGNVLQAGNDLRQMAELGLAVVALDYCQTNDAVCEAQFAALLRHLQRQKWADTNAVAWVGFSLGAEKVTRFWLEHPQLRPALLVRLAGGWMGELEKAEVRSPKSEGNAAGTVNLEPRTLNAPLTLALSPSDGARGQLRAPRTSNAPQPSTQNPQSSTVLLLHGEQDTVFPVADAARVAEALRAKGATVELQVLPGQNHGFNPARGAVFRAVGEYCLSRLRGKDALAQYRSIGTWQAEAWPLWGYGLPALTWGAGWLLARQRAERGKRKAETGGERLSSVAASRESTERRGSRILRGLAAGLALLAAGVTALHFITPRLAVSEGALAVARRFLVPPREREDFEHLAGLPCWRGQRLGTLLEHAHLARYNRGLVNWTVDEAVYREFVLAAVLGGERGESLRWRRALWESLYPRVRKQQSAEAAAETVVRHLRERGTIAASANGDAAIEELWQQQKTDASGFERLTVAGLRSVGIAARLAGDGRGAMWVEGKWQPAPRPVAGEVAVWRTLQGEAAR